MFNNKEVELTGLKIDIKFRATLPLETVAKEIDYSLEKLKVDLLHYRYPENIKELDVYDLLALSTTTILLKDNGIDIAFKLLNLADNLSEYLTPSQKAAYIIMRLNCEVEVNRIFVHQCRETESVQKWFNNNYSQCIENSKLIKFNKNNSQLKPLKLKRPDALVNINGTIYPVECKLKFRNHNLKQLRGYMELMNVDKGYAVAPHFSDSLERSKDIICIISP